jgi:hypothetical protein
VTHQSEHRSYPGVEPQFERAAAETPPFKYRAFLSYSHRDARWAKWLHKALESYRIDKDLVGCETSFGLVPKTLRPIFRDRDDFSAGHSLTEQTLGALEASQFLIVLCSAHAAQSNYVDGEIRHFKSLGRADRVIAIIVDGEPGDLRRECFPPAARFKLDPDGNLTGGREEPIAADARPQGDGKEIAKQKIIAGLLGVALDEILRRAERARRRRNRMLIGAAGLTGILILGAIVGWWAALSVTSRLSSAELLSLTRDAADICERGQNVAEAEHAAEGRRIAFALQCVDALEEGLDELPESARLPSRVVSVFEANLSILRKAKDEGKLAPEQTQVLEKAEIFASRHGGH